MEDMLNWKTGRPHGSTIYSKNPAGYTTRWPHEFADSLSLNQQQTHIFSQGNSRKHDEQKRILSKTMAKEPHTIIDYLQNFSNQKFGPVRPILVEISIQLRI